MDARNELFVYLGSTLATIAGLFTLQIWYESYLDVAVVHVQDRTVPIDAKLTEVRDAEHQKLSSGRMPIDQAMAALVQRGRNGFPKLAAKPSDDLSAMSGWIHKPGFTPYVPRQPPPPPPAEAVPAAAVPGADGTVPAAVPAAEGAAAPAAPGAAPAAEAAAPAHAPTPVLPGAAPAGVPVAPAATGAPAEGARVRAAGGRIPVDARRAPAGRTPSPSPAP